MFVVNHFRHGCATKPAIALAQIQAACEADIPRGVVLMDAGYGADTSLRAEITSLGLAYAAGIQPNTTVWPQGTGPLPPKDWSGRGRPTSRLRRDGEHQPVQAKALALGLPQAAWETVTWREGSADWLTSRYARMRVRPAHRDERRKEPRARNGS
jgi:SRSO17 transposase